MPRRAWAPDRVAPWGSSKTPRACSRRHLQGRGYVQAVRGDFLSGEGGLRGDHRQSLRLKINAAAAARTGGAGAPGAGGGMAVAADPIRRHVRERRVRPLLSL